MDHLIILQLKHVKNRELMSAVLEVLKRHHGAGYRVDKPRVAVTYTVTIDGLDEESFHRDLVEIATAAGWILVK